MYNLAIVGLSLQVWWRYTDCTALLKEETDL